MAKTKKSTTMYVEKVSSFNLFLATSSLLSFELYNRVAFLWFAVY